jgi:hypothetical protein
MVVVMDECWAARRAVLKADWMVSQQGWWLAWNWAALKDGHLVDETEERMVGPTAEAKAGWRAGH